MSDFTLIEYTHEDVVLKGQLILPAGPGPHPAVLVMHDARGMGPQVFERARRLAALGYVALATDMYGDGVFFEDSLEAGPFFMALHERPESLRSRVVAGFDVLKARPEVDPNRIGAIGFCFGGECVLELARSGVDVKAVASYHGLLTTELPAKPGAVKAQVAVFTGGQDPYAPIEHVDAFRAEMTAADADWHLTIHGKAFHAFTEPGAAEAMANIPGLGYHKIADQISWASALALFEETIR